MKKIKLTQGAINNTKKTVFYLIAIAFLFVSCYKTNLVFDDELSTSELDITFFDGYKVEIATYKTDSIVTSGSNFFMIGTHYDTLFSKVSSESYAELSIPEQNPVGGIKDGNIIFDSIVIVLIPSGSYYGDTLKPISLSVYELAEPIENEDKENNIFYNPRSFTTKQILLGNSIIMNPRLSKREELTIRLSDKFGEDLLNKLRNKDEVVNDQESFRDYFKGICIKGDSNLNRNILHFNAGKDDKLLRIYYHSRELFLTEKTIEFGFIESKQFNHFEHNTAATNFSIFRPYKKELKESTKMNGKALIGNHMPSYMKVTFPGIHALKELSPYILVVKAELEIKPAPGSIKYPYKLPEELEIFGSNGDNRFDYKYLAPNDSAQNGNLVRDGLNGKNTKYSFDITSFVNTLLNDGVYTTKALFIGIKSNGVSQEIQRLAINEQSSSMGIKLKLYVLGL